MCVVRSWRFHVLLEALMTPLSTFLNVQALDKIRFLSLTDQSLLGEGDDAKLDIHVRLWDHTL